MPVNNSKFDGVPVLGSAHSSFEIYVGRMKHDGEYHTGMAFTVDHETYYGSIALENNVAPVNSEGSNFDILTIKQVVIHP